METKFTKGKWFVSEPYLTITDEKGFAIAQQHGIKNSHEWEANALLISKAPEMFEMLENIVNYGGVANFDKIEQLLKEATQL